MDQDQGLLGGNEWEWLSWVKLSCVLGIGGHGRRSVKGRPVQWWPGAADLFQRDGGWGFEMAVHGVLAARQALDSLPRLPRQVLNSKACKGAKARG